MNGKSELPLPYVGRALKAQRQALTTFGLSIVLGTAILVANFYRPNSALAAVNRSIALHQKLLAEATEVLVVNQKVLQENYLAYNNIKRAKVKAP
ncbi:MAG TPA: hypothetical protein VFT72_10265 [Opitutaceae bacterium]|nr:hypothetical protein [Opitutaceae bacterium]